MLCVQNVSHLFTCVLVTCIGPDEEKLWPRWPCAADRTCFFLIQEQTNHFWADHTCQWCRLPQLWPDPRGWQQRTCLQRHHPVVARAGSRCNTKDIVLKTCKERSGQSVKATKGKSKQCWIMIDYWCDVTVVSNILSKDKFVSWHNTIFCILYFLCTDINNFIHIHRLLLLLIVLCIEPWAIFLLVFWWLNCVWTWCEKTCDCVVYAEITLYSWRDVKIFCLNPRTNKPFLSRPYLPVVYINLQKGSGHCSE